jgi:hypothetical protein
VLLEKDRQTKLVGFYMDYFDSGDKVRDILKLVSLGWAVKIIYSCYSWTWESYRYVDGSHDRDWNAEQDCYGRIRVQDLWLGWKVKVDILEEDGSRFRRYVEVIKHNSATDAEKIEGTMSKELEQEVENKVAVF